MEARARDRMPRTVSVPAWVLGLVPVALLALAAIALFALGAPGLGQRNGIPIEELAVERTVLRPGVIEVTVRNDGPDPVSIEQVSINEGYQPFSGSGEVDRLGSRTVSVPYPWVVGESYRVSLLTATGGTVTSTITAAAETPSVNIGFLGLMALLGIYVGVIPVAIGMVWLPFLRRSGAALVRGLLAFTVGLLGFLGLDALLEGFAIAGAGPQAFGGPLLVLLGAVVSYLALAAVDSRMRTRQARAREGGASGSQLATLVATGIGLHNLGEGLAIGSAYTSGALALGAFLVVGFAIHNTTEGLAIVAPLADGRPRPARLMFLGLIAGAPAVFGAWIAVLAYNASLVSFLLGAGLGAIVQVIVQIAPQMRARGSARLDGVAVAGLLAGVAVMYSTGLLVSV